MAVRREEARLRRAAARRQALRCHYCDARMWLTDPRPFLRQYGLSLDQAARFQCTAEHLVPRHADGPNRKKNVVAACCFCNLQRHGMQPPPDAEAYRAQVRDRQLKGDWHPTWARRLGIVPAGPDPID